MKDAAYWIERLARFRNDGSCEREILDTLTASSRPPRIGVIRDDAPRGLAIDEIDGDLKASIDEHKAIRGSRTNDLGRTTDEE